MFLLQFFTFEQYKKLLALTPLSPGLVSLPNKHRPETTAPKSAHLPKERKAETDAKNVLSRKTTADANVLVNIQLSLLLRGGGCGVLEHFYFLNIKNVCR